jgi:formamidopyrimidine-DNA glycosylase
LPELPDVETYRSYVEETSLGWEVRKVDVRDLLVFQGDPEALGSRLEGESFIDTHRHGKHLFLRIDGAGWLRMHFGMTGHLIFRDREKELPEYSRVILHFDENFLAFVCMRRLGEVEHIEDVEDFIEERGLGVDALRTDFQDFHMKMKDRGGMLKGRLMDQSLVAGIGNIFADEICFQSGFRPDKDVENFGREEWRTIFDSMKDVLETAVEREVKGIELPNNWFYHHRGDGEACPRCDSEIKMKRIYSRSSYYCPSCQRG